MARTRTLTYTGTLTITSCWCGIHLAVPSDLYDEARRTEERAIYCPLGHRFVFGNSTEEQLRESRREEAMLRRRLKAKDDLLRHEEASHRATRGHVTRKKKQLERVSNGVCPCCNRSFVNLARHMESKHPTYVP